MTMTYDWREEGWYLTHCPRCGHATEEPPPGLGRGGVWHVSAAAAAHCMDALAKDNCETEGVRNDGA